MPCCAAHTWLAMLLFGLILMHLAAALFHLWVRRDHVFESMALWTSADARARIERRRKSILGGV